MWLLEKTKALTRWIFVSKVMSLLFHMLSRFVIAFLPRSKHLLISWLQSPSALILKPKKIKSVTVSTISPSICHEEMGPDAMILVFECWVLNQLFHPPLSLSSNAHISSLCQFFLTILSILTFNRPLFLLLPGLVFMFLLSLSWPLFLLFWTLHLLNAFSPKMTSLHLFSSISLFLLSANSFTPQISSSPPILRQISNYSFQHQHSPKDKLSHFHLPAG